MEKKFKICISWEAGCHHCSKMHISVCFCKEFTGYSDLETRLEIWVELDQHISYFKAYVATHYTYKQCVKFYGHFNLHNSISSMVEIVAKFLVLMANFISLSSVCGIHQCTYCLLLRLTLFPLLSKFFYIIVDILFALSFRNACPFLMMAVKYNTMLNMMGMIVI